MKIILISPKWLTNETLFSFYIWMTCKFQIAVNGCNGCTSTAE